MAKLKFGRLGWNRVSPTQELLSTQDGFVEFSELTNYVARNKKIKKIGGTVAYNSTSLGTLSVPWVERSYHIQGDGTIVNRTHVFYNGSIYSGDDVAGTFTEREKDLTANTIPTSFSMQVAGNSILFFLTGADKIRTYDGNGSFAWNESDLDAVDYDTGVVHLDRAWYIKKQTSQVDYSEALLPETIEDSIIVGQDKDSFNRAMVIGANETLYIFKNNSIYQLYGRTPATFQLREVTDKYGLAAKRAIYPVANGFVFLDEFTKELYFFGGTEASIKPLTEDKVRLREIIDLTTDSIANTTMTMHDGLFRFAFQHKEDVDVGDYNRSELIYPIHEPGPDGLPKWSLIRGTNVLSYSNWNKYGDKEELVTGRSDIGKIMYHNRGFDFDGNSILTVARTAEVTASEDKVVRFTGFYVKGKPGSINTTSLFRYYVNGKFSDRGEHVLNLDGEVRLVGEMSIQTQSLFNDRINPFTASNRGNSISFEIRDDNNATELEIYSIAFKAAERYKIRNQLT